MKRKPWFNRLWLGSLAVLLSVSLMACVPRGNDDDDDDSGSSSTTTIERDIQDEIMYFVVPDRFANGDTSNDYGDDTLQGNTDADVLRHGFLPTNRAYHHGGDLAGLISKLDYLKDMGVTAIWTGPLFVNNTVQGDGTVAGSSSSYHGYWIIDFENIDPHMGTLEEFRTYVDEAHARGIKVFLDIVANHTGDIIRYNECHDSNGNPTVPIGECTYRSIADYPYTTKGTPTGDPINEGFDPTVLTAENFALITDPDWAYTTFIPTGLENVKNPAWLNDVKNYHNRGDSTFTGENSLNGDFFGLDDVYTEDPEVVEGMIEIFKKWITDYKIDGFRIDTVKHVNIEFWQQFAPAIKEHARSVGVPEFFMFGEVFDAQPSFMSTYTTEGALPSLLDFSFQGASQGAFAQPGTTRQLANHYDNDDYYIDTDSDANLMMNFVGNHDTGRIGYFIELNSGDESEENKLKRSLIAHALMYFGRGVPVIYYGSEQGFTGDGGDQLSRENMFPSVVDEYNDNNLLGTDATTADDNFNTSHPIYVALKQYGEIYQAHKALRRGIHLNRYSQETTGIYAFSRMDVDERVEYVAAFNNDLATTTATFSTYNANTTYTAVYPADNAALTTDASGQITVSVPALDFVIYRAETTIPGSTEAPTVTITSPVASEVISGRLQVTADVDTTAFAAVTFEVQVSDGSFQTLGTDYTPPYSIYYQASDLANNTAINFRARVADISGNTQTNTVAAVVDSRLPTVTVHYENGNSRTSAYGISNTGYVVFPSSLDSNDSTLTFTWNAGDDTFTLFFETPNGDTFDFDVPVTINLKADVFPVAVDDGSGNLVAELYVNNSGQVSGTNNYDADSTLPNTLARDDSAENPFGSTTIYARGGMNGWGTDDPMSYVGNYTLVRDIALSVGIIEHKFADETWAVYNFGRPFSNDGITLGANPGNLILNIGTGENGLYRFHFFSYPGDTADSRFNFYRLERLLGPLNTDVELKGGLDGNTLIFQGGNLYQSTVTLNSTGTQTFTIGDLADTGSVSFGAVSAESATLTLGTTTTLASGNTSLNFNATSTGEYLFSLDATNTATPDLSVSFSGATEDLGTFNTRLYVRGTIVANMWDGTDSTNQVAYDGNNVFSLTTDVAAGSYEFKVADANWTAETNFGAADGDDGTVTLDTAKTLSASATSGNLTITITEAGSYKFTVDASDSSAPTLTVSRQ